MLGSRVWASWGACGASRGVGRGSVGWMSRGSEGGVPGVGHGVPIGGAWLWRPREWGWW